MLILKTIAESWDNVVAITPGSLADSEGNHVIKHYSLPTPRANFWYHAEFSNTLRAVGKRLKNIFLLIQKLFQIKPDILVCCEPDSWAVSIMAKCFLGCKVVVDLREVYEDRVLSFPKIIQKPLRRMLKVLMTALSRFTNEVIHVSPERQQVYSYLNKPGVVIGPYPELHLFQPRDISQNEVYANNDQKSVIAIHAGALRVTYASDQLLKAMMLAAELFPEIRLVVLGGIAGALSNVHLVESLKKKGILELVKHVPYFEVVRTIQVSDIGINLVLPVDTTHVLAAPQKLFEYMAAGIPVVAADVHTIRSIIKKYECGLLVDPTSPHEIASALVKFAQDANMRKKMGQNARRAAEAEFNWEIEKKKLYGVFKFLQFS